MVERDGDRGPTPGSFTVAVRVGGERWVGESVNCVDPADGREVDCAIAEAEYRIGELRMPARASCGQGYDGTYPFVGRDQSVGRMVPNGATPCPSGAPAHRSTAEHTTSHSLL